MRKIAVALIGFTLLAVPAAAEACRLSIPLSQRLDSWYENGMIDTVFIGEVTETQEIEGFPAETGRWASEVQVLSVQHGRDLPATYVIDDRPMISSCGWETNVRSERGDRAVFYLTSDHDGRRYISVALPLDEALRIDPRLNYPAETP